MWKRGYVAGCFLVSSPQPDFFSQRLQYLLQIYAYLLSMAFEMEAFYAPERILLRLTPEEPMQRDRIAGFQQRVMTLLQGDLTLTRLEAERAAWQQIEEELLALTLRLNQQRR
jgi:hypothetical protein